VRGDKGVRQPGRQRPVCGACGCVHYKNPAAGVATGVVQDRRVGFGRYGPATRVAGTWSLPAGFIEYGESFPEAVMRETWERLAWRSSSPVFSTLPPTCGPRISIRWW
jgi:8-oxo-dGTP pyrophosphatase MutT (NUDIX family)